MKAEDIAKLAPMCLVTRTSDGQRRRVWSFDEAKGKCWTGPDNRRGIGHDYRAPMGAAAIMVQPCTMCGAPPELHIEKSYLADLDGPVVLFDEQGWPEEVTARDIVAKLSEPESESQPD